MYECSFGGSGTPVCSIDGGPMEACEFLTYASFRCTGFVYKTYIYVIRQFLPPIGSLEGEIDVFDYPPGPHTAAITVGNNTQVFRFTTPGM